MKKALITGATGQDGSYLAELLLEKGYKVYGIQRRASTFNTNRINHLYDRPEYPNFETFYGDLTDTGNIIKLINQIKPDEIYHLAAQSHVRVSFDMPEYTANTDALGTLRILEAIKNSGRPIKFYQASSSEMFGTSPPPQNEKTPFHPRSPYAVSKVFAYHITRLYREAYGIFACNGILFNHESERRGETFVTRKITRGLVRIKLGIDDKLYLGNLNAKRDWGYAEEYVECMWRMLQQDKADDCVIATGESHSVREFTEEAAKLLGFNLAWQGADLKEKGIDRKTSKTIIEIDPVYFRPAEVEVLIGDASKAKEKLGWMPKTKFKELTRIMIEADYNNEKRNLK
ncbi:GDP-mannose 4,6-dehydratase [Candidatus Parcubacteria bacterium]|nr:GDP-mannose 4,6-dehydratase [Candidatus Parcubacteria bacterium]